MSERRERIDRAIDELVVACLETADTPDDEPGAVARILAEQRLRAALDAEPTEAEIDAACPECGGHGRGCSFCSGTGDWPRTSEPTEAEIEAASEVLWNRKHESNMHRIDTRMTWRMANQPSAALGWGDKVAEVRGDARAALLAARNARHE